MKRIKEWFIKGAPFETLRAVDGIIKVAPAQFKIRPFFAWYDFWIGIYVDEKRRLIYVFPLPMIGFKIGYQ